MKEPQRLGLGGISPSGALYLMLSLGLLALGLLKNLLVASVLGFGLVAFFCFNLVSVTAAYLAWRKIDPIIHWVDGDMVEVSLSDFDSARQWRYYLARAYVSVRYAKHLSSEKPFTLHIQIEAAITKATMRVLSRGKYIPQSSAVRLSDFAGFVTLRRALPPFSNSEALFIYPDPKELDQAALPPGKFGAYRGKSTFLRSDNLYESRAYVTGDDPRKINWKTYAHTGNLSVREGELQPPPADEYFIVINTVYQAQEIAGCENAFDLLINRVFWVAGFLLTQQKKITLAYLTSEGNVVSEQFSPAEPNAYQRLQRFCSEPQPCRASTRNHPEVAGAATLFFTLPTDLSSLPRQYRTSFFYLYMGPVPHKSSFANMRALWDFLVFIPKPDSQEKFTRAYRRQYLAAHTACLAGGIDVKEI